MIDMINGENRLFVLLDRHTNKIIAESSTKYHAWREADWRGSPLKPDGTSKKFVLREIIRLARFGISRCDRYGAKWPPAKVREFCKDYLDGVLQKDLCQMYDCNPCTLSRIIKRMRKPTERFDKEQDPLMLYMLTEGMTINEIAQHFERAPDSIILRLKYICPEETRSRLYRAERQFREMEKARRKEERARARQTPIKLAIPYEPAETCSSYGGAYRKLPSSIVAQLYAKLIRWSDGGFSGPLFGNILCDERVRPSSKRQRVRQSRFSQDAYVRAQRGFVVPERTFGRREYPGWNDAA